MGFWTRVLDWFLGIPSEPEEQYTPNPLNDEVGFGVDRRFEIVNPPSDVNTSKTKPVSKKQAKKPAFSKEAKVVKSATKKTSVKKAATKKPSTKKTGKPTSKR